MNCCGDATSHWQCYVVLCCVCTSHRRGITQYNKRICFYHFNQFNFIDDHFEFMSRFNSKSLGLLLFFLN